MKNKLFVPAVALLFLVACQNDKGHQQKGSVVRTVFFDSKGMDSTVKPGDNFFLYANGKWMKNTQIPKTETEWGVVNSLYNDNLKNLRTILETAAKRTGSENSNEKKVGDLYASGMDSLTIEKLGVKPVRSVLAKIDAIKNDRDLMNISINLTPSR